MAIAEITIIPVGTGSTSVSGYVADCHRLLAGQKEVKYTLTPMGTILEGELEQILALSKVLHEVPFEKGAARAITCLRIDDRRDQKGTMAQKIESVTQKLEQAE